jgi:hypothetical protein
MNAAHTPQSLDTSIRFAIAHQRLIEVRYSGAVRLAEPHDYGIQKGVERLLVYQLRGPARASRQSATGWRLLDTSKIEGCAVLEERFGGSRGRSHRNHLAWDVVHARVA